MWPERCAVGDPAFEQGGFGRIAVKSPAALVVHAPGGFLEEQAFRRIRQVHAPRAEFSGQREMILRLIVAEQAQPEAALAGGGTVAPARIAAGLRQHRQDARGQIEPLGVRGKACNQ